jgi:hypothetical protein
MAHCREKVLRQPLQTNGFSPVWALRCLARCSDLRKAREQKEHFFSAELVLVAIAAHTRSNYPSFVHYYCCGQSQYIFMKKSEGTAAGRAMVRPAGGLRFLGRPGNSERAPTSVARFQHLPPTLRGSERYLRITTSVDPHRWLHM